MTGGYFRFVANQDAQVPLDSSTHWPRRSHSPLALRQRHDAATYQLG